MGHVLRQSSSINKTFNDCSQKIKFLSFFFCQSSCELENDFCFEDGNRKKKVQFYQGNAFTLRVSNLTFGVLVRLQNFTLLN